MSGYRVGDFLHVCLQAASWLTPTQIVAGKIAVLSGKHTTRHATKQGFEKRSRVSLQMYLYR